MKTVKQKLLGIAILAVITTVIVVSARFPSHQIADNLLCPTQYPTAEAATAGFQSFSDQFYAARPNATLGDMLRAREDFYVSHNCTVELQRSQQLKDGKADPTTMEMIDGVIRQATQKQ